TASPEPTLSPGSPHASDPAPVNSSVTRKISVHNEDGTVTIVEHTSGSGYLDETLADALAVAEAHDGDDDGFYAGYTLNPAPYQIGPLYAKLLDKAAHEVMENMLKGGRANG